MPSPVKVAAERLGLEVVHRVDDILGRGVERGVVVAFGKLIKPHVLDEVPMVNLHFSLLPRWRGAAPVERAILAGDEETGVCVMELEEGLDTGPVYERQSTTIDPDESADHLRGRLVTMGTAMLVDLLRGELPPALPQTGEATYAAKIDPAELQIDWTRDADEVHRLVRLGRAWTTVGGRRLRVLETAVLDPSDVRKAAAGVMDGDVVGCGAGALRLVRVQAEGKPPVDATAWLRGARLPAGAVLGQ